jgi:hypothetical protein
MGARNPSIASISGKPADLPTQLRSLVFLSLQVRIPAGLLTEIDTEYGVPGRVLFESWHGHPFCWQYIKRELARASKRVLGR